MVRVLVIGRTPPPYLGAPIMLEYLVRSQMEGVALHHLPISLSADDAENGKFRWLKLARLLWFIVRIIAKRITSRSDILYYTPELAQPRSTVLRDATILALIRPFFSKTIFHLHASGFAELYQQLSSWQRWLVRLGYFYADAVIRQSTLTPDDGREMKARREYIVPNGIIDPFPEHAQRSLKVARGANHNMRILFISGLREGKGILVLLEACARLLQRGVPFQLEVGGKWYEPGLEERAKKCIHELKLDGRVQFLGVVDNAEKFAAFAKSDVLCHPTFFDTFPIVVLEGMAAGIPVVSTTHSGIPSMVEDGITGFLVAPRDAEALAARLADLATNAGLSARMGAAGRQRFEEQFTLPRHIERMRDVFLHLAGARQSTEPRKCNSGTSPIPPLADSYRAMSVP
jgi:glycosyltransferase involved in cell wall biosynthesis